MFISVFRVLVLAVVLISVIGRAMAFSLSTFVETSVYTHSSLLNAQENNQDSTTSDTEKEDKCCEIECCDVICICIFNACSSVAFCNANATSLKSTMLFEMSYSQTYGQPKSVANLLYRPPIIFL